MNEPIDVRNYDDCSASPYYIPEDEICSECGRKINHEKFCSKNK
jgi:hypothetical protein